MGKQIKTMTLYPDGKSFRAVIDDESLEDLQMAVGGPVEYLPVSDRLSAWLHEEGAYSLAPNPVASLAVSMLSGVRRRLFGPVVFTGPPDSDGNSTSIADVEVSTLYDYSAALSNVVKNLVALDLHEWAVATLGRRADL